MNRPTLKCVEFIRIAFRQPQFPSSINNPIPTGPSTSFKRFASTEAGPSNFAFTRPERDVASGFKTSENQNRTNVCEKGDISNPVFPEGIGNKNSLNEMAKSNQFTDFMKWFIKVFPAGPNGRMNISANPAFLPAPGTTMRVINAPTSNPSQFVPLLGFPRYRRILYLVMRILQQIFNLLNLILELEI